MGDWNPLRGQHSLAGNHRERRVMSPAPVACAAAGPASLLSHIRPLRRDQHGIGPALALPVLPTAFSLQPPHGQRSQ